jgi:hypothetical protein
VTARARSAREPQRPGFPADESFLGPPLGDWISAPRKRLASVRTTVPEKAGPRTAASGPIAVADVEAELARLVRAAAPTRRVMCALAARAVEIRSGSRLGFARTRDQARERHGTRLPRTRSQALLEVALPVRKAASRAGASARRWLPSS